MKNLLKFSFLFILFAFCMVSCEDDPCEGVSCGPGTCVDGTCDCPEGFTGDNCDVCDDLTKSIIGTWSTANFVTSGEITLESDGTLVDTDCLILEYENGGVPGTIKTWELNGDEITFTNMVDPSQGSGSATTTGTVISFDCDEFKIDYSGFFTMTLTRI